MLYNKKILITSAILVVGIIILLLLNNTLTGIQSSMGSRKSVTYEGYVIRNWEALYFAPNSPVVGNNNQDKIWIKSNGGWEKRLNWMSVNNSNTVEYAKVRIEGKLYGPGIYGSVPGYKHEIDIEKIEQIP